ncbi:PilZ domain-containing protein [Sphingomonas sp. CGMCC 1.13654]|uniref:PilZ domain-containing protein n=1 Tax=Sphingomonas chungangi TaxID=2683589 RepID=A0A838L2I8_9SPHN|nr:PilZ domain-containing protein [Sphingomonas chungangi]MVW57947.1 PilZ domain-containing protein [Sphingomonas chungangi]
MEETPIGSHTPEGNAESQRRDQRDSLFVLARIKLEGQPGEGVSVRVRNVSSGGLMADAPDDYRPGMRIEVAIENVGEVAGSVAWAEAGRIGVAFDHPIDKARARKTKSGKPDELFRPVTQKYRRPGLKPETRG